SAASAIRIKPLFGTKVVNVSCNAQKSSLLRGARMRPFGQASVSSHAAGGSGGQREGGFIAAHRAVERVPLEGLAARGADQLQQLAPPERLCGGGAGVVVDLLLRDG